MEEALLSGSLVNKRLNLRACIVGKSLETAVVKTYRLIQSGFLSQHSATMQLSPNVAASNTAPNALVVKTFWSKPLIYRERHTKNGPNRRRRARVRRSGRGTRQSRSVRSPDAGNGHERSPRRRLRERCGFRRRRGSSAGSRRRSTPS